MVEGSSRMKILFITNYYSPCQRGWGYRQLCEEIADGLTESGHDIAVLTSTCGNKESGPASRQYPVHRLLPIDPDWQSGRMAAWQFLVGRRQRERQAVADFGRIVSQFKPDIVFVWHAIGLPRQLLEAAEGMSDTIVVYYLAGYLPELPDEYIAYWQKEPVRWIAKLLKHPLRALALRILEGEGKPIHLEYENVICVSNYVRDRLVSQHKISSSAVVIHNGVDLSVFSPDEKSFASFSSEGLRCLIAGHIVPEKGIHTAIDALAELTSFESSLPHVTLTILGGGQEKYLEQLKMRTKVNSLEGIVEFRSPVPRTDVPKVLAQHNVLILPSEYDEPLARAMQEGMAMGLLVIGTTTGGSGELLVHEETGLAFEPGNSQSLANQLRRVLEEPELARQLAKRGQQRVTEGFNIELTVRKIEQHLTCLLEEQRDNDSRFTN